MKKKEFFRKLHQKRLFRFLTYALMVLFFPILGFYMHFIEPRLLWISHLKIPIKKLPKTFHGFRVVQISDLHFGPANHAPSFLKKCIQKINRLKPDMVAMTGDFMQWDSSHARPLAELLSHLKARFGLFASLGNHDYGVCHPHQPPSDPVNHQEVMTAFHQAGIRVLHNEQATIMWGTHELHIVGLGDLWTPHFDPKKAFSNKKKAPTILLSHNPDSIRHLENFDFDLMLSGHVHGGQISFPWIGPLVVPVKERHLRRGLHRIANRWLYTNRGLGQIFKARLLSIPEITCLDLVPES